MKLKEFVWTENDVSLEWSNYLLYESVTPFGKFVVEDGYNEHNDAAVFFNGKFLSINKTVVEAKGYAEKYFSELISYCFEGV